ncbi:MAG: polyprenyl synthetase family protein [Flaviflexus sp.]|nr:polyprenyl synthetase family protein [Flaviflexus sp.]
MERLANLVTDATLDALATHAGTLADADAELLESFVAPARQLLGGGKRVRGLLSIAGAMCAGARVEDADSPAIEVAAALELFQGAALVHDDIMDDSPTRRGLPAVHMAFQHACEDSELVGDAALFGRDAGICSGDYLLAISTSQMLKAGQPRALARFQTMCAEVAFGQYLDIRGENIDLAGMLDDDPAQARERLLRAREDALLVLRHKAARYSVRDPLLIGAEAAGGSPELLDALARLGEPLGEAFQLRDDALGIAGDSKHTGKPTGGDLREGKRTVLLLTSLIHTAGTEAAKEIYSALGSDLTEEESLRIARLIQQSGAWEEHEEMISAREEAARSAWSRLPAGPGADLLWDLMDRLTRRKH